MIYSNENYKEKSAVDDAVDEMLKQIIKEHAKIYKKSDVKPKE